MSDSDRSLRRGAVLSCPIPRFALIDSQSPSQQRTLVTKKGGDEVRERRNEAIFVCLNHPPSPPSLPSFSSRNQPPLPLPLPLQLPLPLIPTSQYPNNTSYPKRKALQAHPPPLSLSLSLSHRETPNPPVHRHRLKQASHPSLSLFPFSVRPREASPQTSSNLTFRKPPSVLPARLPLPRSG